VYEKLNGFWHIYR